MRPIPRASSSRTAYFALALFWASIVGVLGYFGPPQMSGEVQALYPKTSQTLSDLLAIEATFGANLIDVLIVPFSETDLEETRDSWLELEEQILAIPEVVSVYSPIPALRSLHHPLRMISEDRKWARFLIEIPSDLADEKRRLLHDELDALRPEGSVRSGSFFASEVATSTLTAESQIRAPLCAVSIFVLLLLWTRSVAQSLIVLLPSLMALATVSVGLVMFDHPLGAIAHLVPPLLLAVSTSYSSYIAGRILNARDSETALHGVGKSIAFATITTLVGFLALLWMDCRGVKDFALIMAAGTAFAALYSWWLVPRLLHRRSLVAPKTAYQISRSLAVGLSAVIALLCLASSAGIAVLHVDTVPLDFFADPSPERQSIEAAEARFPGSHILSVGFELPEPLNQASLQSLISFTANLNGFDGVTYVFGAPAFSKLYDELKAKGVTDSTFLGQYGPASITSADGKHTRLVIETDREGAALIKLAHAIRERLQSFHAENIVTWVASRELVISEQSDRMTKGLIESVLFALLIVWALLLVTFRKLSVSLLGIIPNLLPILGIFGLIGLVSNAVNLGAAIVAACALGMVSDFTFHLLFLWRSLGPERLDEAVDCSLRPFVLTGLTLVVGFAPTIISPVAPVRSFGIFLGSALVLGIFFNLTLLPYLLKKCGAVPASE